MGKEKRATKPMDEQGSRTMFVGLMIAFALFGLSVLLPVIWKHAWAPWVGIGLNVAAVVLMAVWFLMVRGGFRIGKPPSRGERRAKMHAAEEKEKRQRLLR